MTKAQVVDWFQQTVAQLQQVGQLEESINKIKGLLDLAEASGDSNQVMQMTAALHKQEELLAKLTPVVLTRTKTTDLERARAFSQDFQIRWQQAEEEYNRWREGYAKLELIQATDGFAGENGDDLRMQVNVNLNKQQARYETAFKLVVDSIPSSVSLIHV